MVVFEVKSLKRIFIVKSSTATTSPNFSLRNIAGTSGRLDVICRSIINAFLVNGSIRREIEFYGVLEGPPNPPKTIFISGSELSYLPRDEVAMAKIVKHLLSGASASPGFHLLKIGFKKLVSNFKSRDFKLTYLHEKGSYIRDFNFDLNEEYCFILGGHLGLDLPSELFLFSLNIPCISLGSVKYLTSQCITIVNEFLDRFHGYK